MPDPILYLKAFVAVVFSSAIVLLAFWLVTRRHAWSLAASCVLAASVGLLIGYDVLLFSWTWPPANALNRFLMIVLPATVIVELLTAVCDAGFFSRSLVVVLRVTLYACAGRVLLHDSVYLAGVGGSSADSWTLLQSIATLSGGFGVLIAVWSLLCRLSQRSASPSIILSLAMAILCSGLATMMAGYIKGGVAAIPLVAALVGITLASPVLANRLSDHGKPHLQGTIGIGVMGLFSLLCIGHYFGQLSGPRAVVIFLAPLLCWTSELPVLSSKSPFQKSVVRLIAVTIPLAAVLFAAGRDFDQKMAPLLAGAMPCEKPLIQEPRPPANADLHSGRFLRVARSITVAFLNPARRRQGGVRPSEAMVRGRGCATGVNISNVVQQQPLLDEMLQKMSLRRVRHKPQCKLPPGHRFARPTSPRRSAWGRLFANVGSHICHLLFERS